MIRTLAGAAGSLLVLLAAARGAASSQRPNILFIFSDDHAAQAISAYGSTTNRTPNIDRIAHEGMLFRNCFVANSICTPSRATILSGKHSHMNGVYNVGDKMDNAQPTFPKMLQSAGYQTALIGKWHLGHGPGHDPSGFDYWNVLVGQGPYYNPAMIENGTRIQHAGYTTHVITDQALKWLSERRDPNKPFLLMCQHKAPHRNWVPGPDRMDDYDDEAIAEPRDLFDTWENRSSTARLSEMSIANHFTDDDLQLRPPQNLNEEQLKRWKEGFDAENQGFREANLSGDELTRWRYQRYIKNYLRCVASVDDSVGTLLKYLDDTGLADNTVVIYSSDQGFFLGDHGWYDKRFMYEESLRTPLVVRWPGVTKAGSQDEHLAQNLDFAQTFLEIAGVEPPPDMQGRSLVPLLKGERPDDWRDAIYYHYYDFPSEHQVRPHFGVRTDRYKLIHYYTLDEWELFDLETDTHELKSVHDDPAYADVRANLQEKLKELQLQYKDTNPTQPVPRPHERASNAHYISNRPPLQPSALIKLPIGSIRPEGWLRHQLELMADGQTGRLPELSKWCRFEGSAWTSSDGRGNWPWEEAPYWLKGFGDLGYVLGDQRIIDEATGWVQAVMNSQRADGYFGPRANIEPKPGKQGHGPQSGETPDLWPTMVMLNVLQSHHEASGEKRVLELMTRYFRWQLERAQRENIFPGFWDKMRAGDNLESVYWLYNRTGESWLLELAEHIHKAAAPWSQGVPNWHGVNIAQGFREPAIWYLQTRDPIHLAAAERNYTTVMDKYGQMPGGMFAADENAREGYDDPRQAAETCSIIEFMHSFQMLAGISGDLVWADRCEDVAFNSLPASMSEDLKSLHYLTAANQPVLSRSDKSPGIQNASDMFSYNPDDYRCCQHNHSHGWPYYAEHLWMATPDNGLAALLYSACSVKAKVGDEGVEVRVSQLTDYPFSETIHFKLATPKPVKFPVRLRVPAWAKTPQVQINGRSQSALARPQAFIVLDRTWNDGDDVTLTLPMPLRVKTWEKNKNAVSIYRGPLAFSLKIGEEKRPFWNNGRLEAHERWPTTPWNYGLVLDPDAPEASLEVIETRGVIPAQPWSAKNAPIQIRCSGRRIPSWRLGKGELIDAVPPSPIRSDEPTERITLIPMGAARLRISAFPVIASQQVSQV